MPEEIQRDILLLLKLLGDMTALHESWLPLAEKKREALASSNVDALSQCLQLENQNVQAVGEMEKQRLEIVGRITQHLNPQATSPMKMVDLAEALPEPTRSKLLLARQALRERVEAIKTQSSIARRATDSLLKHMNGLVRSVASAALGGATYDPSGHTSDKPLRMSTLNLTA